MLLSWLSQRLNSVGGVAVAPSLLSADFSVLYEEIRAVEKGGADFLHLDIMDGHFVPNISFGPGIVETINKVSRIPLLTHLMISNPADYVDRFIQSGSDVVTFHTEAMEEGQGKLIKKIQEQGCAAGIAINPPTPLSAVEKFLDKIDLLLIMSVIPGFGGQDFRAEVLEKIEAAARIRTDKGYHYVIEVDGGIRPSNAASVRRAGAQVLVSGTGIFKSPNYSEAILAIRG